MSVSTHTISGIELFDVKNINRATIADGNLLNTYVYDPLIKNEDILASAVGSAYNAIDDINRTLQNKKDKQTALSFDGAATKTVKKITQNANGEMNVEFEDINLPPEVPNVEITSEDNSVQVTETTDVQTNTKTFDLSVNVDDPLEYGQFRATNVTAQAQLAKIKGNLDLSTYSINLKKGNSYHFTIRGSYVANSAVNTSTTISYIEYSSFTNIPVNVDNTITDPQYFEISYDVYNYGQNSAYNVSFASMLSGKVSELWVEVHNLNGVSVNGSGGDSVMCRVYSTLQDAISDATNLTIGDNFETNGFRNYNDGGAARYLVSDTGTANGMDIIDLGNGKLAVLQAGDHIIPEQLGYVQSYSGYDVVPYIQRAIAIGCQHIHLRSSGTGAGYTWKSKLTIAVRGFKLTGEGDWGYPNKFTYVKFIPNESVTSMIDLTMRDALISDIDFEVTGNNVKLVDGITSSTYNMDETRFWEFRNLRFNSFRKCIYLGGTIKWQNIIKDCLFNYCTIGIEMFESSTMQLLIENCMFIGCESHDILFNGNILSAKMICCNFGSVDNAVAFKVNSDTCIYHNASFESCNFENDNADGHNRRAIAIDLYDTDHPGIRQNITISNCHFTIGKQSAPIQDRTNRFIRLGDTTHLVFMNNQILGYNEPEHTSWDTDPKLLWDEQSLPVNGEIVCVGRSTSLEFPDELLPYLQRYNEVSRISVTNARTGTESSWSDCNTWIPDENGQIKWCRVSTYEGTENMPTSGLLGYLAVCGVKDGPNIRVMQSLQFTNNGNIYNRRGVDNGNGFIWENWKTLSAT